MHRRAFLGSVVAGGAGPAGCPGPSEDTVEVGHIDLGNSDEQPRTVSPEMLFDGDTVVEETRGVVSGGTVDRTGGSSSNDRGQDHITVDPAVFESELPTPGVQTGAGRVTLEHELFSPDSPGVVRRPVGR